MVGGSVKTLEDFGRRWKSMEEATWKPDSILVLGRRYVESNLGEGKWRQTRRIEFTEGISNLRERKSNLRIFDINPATKFEYRGKSNLVAPELMD